MTGTSTPGERSRLDALAEYLMEREDALTVDCPRCAEPAGQLCRNPITGAVIRAPAHWQRIHRATTTPPDVATP